MAFSWLRIFAQRLLRPVVDAHSRSRKQQRIVPRIEVLEARDVPTIFLTPDYVVRTAANSETPLATISPTGYTPSEISQAYGFNQISFNGTAGITAGTGAGTTIAIVDAYSDPAIASDLHAFDQEFGIANPKLTVVNQNGGTTLPSANADWAGEISLDVEWAHAMAPGANILLVEATNDSLSNLFTAVKYAAAQKGVVAVSMSWGGSEFSGETSYDSAFTPPASNPDVVFINSAGDSGAPAEYPSTSPNVLSVGGTTLNLTSSGSYSSESAWSGGGGGISAYESQPSYQKGTVTQSTTQRTSPDVSYDANPDTGFPVYQTYGNNSSDPWLQYGGTSDAAPQWAALVAIADQGRELDGEAALSGTALMKDLYSLPSSDFHDITSGTTDGSPRESATKGYDLATGIGTPIANLVVVGLVGGSSTTSSAVHFSISGAATATAGGSYSFTVTALNANDQVDTGYTGTVTFTSSDPLAVLPANYTFKASDDGTHTFTVVFKTAGTQSLTVTDTSNSGETGSETGITVYPGADTELVYLQQPSSGLVGKSINPAVTVEEVDQFGNVVSTDNTTKITLSLGSNPGGATLSGGGTVTVTNGIATFGDVALSAAGTGYTLVASTGTLAATSSPFNIATSTTNTIENFQNGLGNYYYIGNSYPFVGTTPTAAHPGTASEGLLDEGDGNWYFREDSGAVVSPGDTISTWINFSGSANGRAYFGFGTTGNGLDSVVLAPNSDQFIIQNNAGFNTYTNLAAANQTYSANTWYLVQIQWGTSGTVTASLYASNGTTLLNTVTAATGDTVAGTFAFRAIGSTKYFSTVTDTPGVNNFAARTELSNSTTTPSNGTVRGTSSSQSETGSGGQSTASYLSSITSPTTAKSETRSIGIGGYPLFFGSEYDPFAIEEWSVWVGR
jgi:hypothetical protein